MKRRTVPLEERFWAKVDKQTGASACWLWTASRSSLGYGRIRIEGKNVGAHRVSWTLSRGEIPAGLGVLHHCDRPSCVRLEHLFLGTQADNSADMVAKGRWRRGQLPTGNDHYSRRFPHMLARGDRHWSARKPERVVRGTAHGMSVLNEIVVHEARDRHAQGETFSAIAADLGFSKQVIRLAVRGITWSHVK